MVEGVRAIDQICGYADTAIGMATFTSILWPMNVATVTSLKERTAFELIYDKVAKYNGSISAEHGIGQTKRAQLAKSNNQRFWM